MSDPITHVSHVEVRCRSCRCEASFMVGRRRGLVRKRWVEEGVCDHCDRGKPCPRAGVAVSPVPVLVAIMVILLLVCLSLAGVIRL